MPKTIEDMINGMTTIWIKFKKIDPVLTKIKRIIKSKGVKRNDLLATICTRLQLFVTSSSYTYKAVHKENMVRFLINEDMEAGLRFGIHGAISNAPEDIKKECGALISDPRLARTILSSM